MLQRTNATKIECCNERMLKRTNAAKNECYNERMLQRTNATTNEFYKERMLQRTNSTTKECCNERMLQRKNAAKNECYVQRMLQRTVCINKIRMLQRTRRNNIGRRSTRVRMTCRSFPLRLERQSSSLLSFVSFSYQFSSVICLFAPLAVKI